MDVQLGVIPCVGVNGDRLIMVTKFDKWDWYGRFVAKPRGPGEIKVVIVGDVDAQGVFTKTGIFESGDDTAGAVD